MGIIAWQSIASQHSHGLDEHVSCLTHSVTVFLLSSVSDAADVDVVGLLMNLNLGYEATGVREGGEEEQAGEGKERASQATFSR